MKILIKQIKDSEYFDYWKPYMDKYNIPYGETLIYRNMDTHVGIDPNKGDYEIDYFEYDEADTDEILNELAELLWMDFRTLPEDFKKIFDNTPEKEQEALFNDYVASHYKELLEKYYDNILIMYEDDAYEKMIEYIDELDAEHGIYR